MSNGSIAWYIFVHQYHNRGRLCSSTAPQLINIMPDKRHSSEMALDELRILLRDTKRRVVVLEAELKRRTCVHSFAVRHVNGPRDNGEHEYVCSNCGIVY